MTREDVLKFAEDNTTQKRFLISYWRGDTCYSKEIMAKDVYSAVKKSRIKNIYCTSVFVDGGFQEVY